ncbi:MAG: hypothetical protein FWG64_06140, partial [Firmicutes bacterium]|nr:hypothetical protein [Bacillota bacterium]
AGGEYSAGTLSYMNDTCTTVAYTLARKPAVNEPLWHVPKKSRVVIYFDFPVGFFVGKIYLPVRQAGGDSSQFTVANFAETIGECLKPAFDCTSDNAKFHRLEEHKVHKTPYSLHYIDYCVTFTVNSQKTIDCETGQPAYCVECGKRLEKSNKLSCCLSADRQAMKLLTVIVANNLRKSGICRLLATFGFAIIAINLALIVAKNLIGQPTLGLIWITVIGNLGKMSSFANIALAKISNG